MPNRARYAAWLPALVLFAAGLAFYVVTLQPGLAWGDGIRLQREAISAESFILAEIADVTFAPDPWPFARLGVAAWDHPLYVIIGHTLVQTFPAADPLWLVNLVSAVFAAATLAVLYALLYRHTRSVTAAGGAALALAVSHTFWWHAATPEVYTLFTFLLLLTVWLADDFLRRGRPAALVGAALALGLGLANHLLAGLALPALAGVVVWNRLRPLRAPVVLLPRRVTVWAAVLAALLIGFAPYWVQLLRLLRTFTLGELLGPALGVTFFRGSLVTTPTAAVQSSVMYLVFLLYQFNPLGVGLGVYGWLGGRRAAPRLWRAALLLYAVYLLFGLVYQVSDQFAFFIGAHVWWAVGLGLGIARLQARRMPGGRRALAPVVVLSALALPLVYAAAPGLLRGVGVDDVTFGIPQIGTGVRDGLNYYLNPNKRGDREAERFGRTILDNLPPDSVVLAEWYTDTDEYFVLRYYTAVDGLRPDLTIVGWPTVDPFTFDPALASELVAATLPARPVYLASLSAAFYDSPALLARYCVVPEHALYRVYPVAPGADAPCLPVTAAQP